MRRTIAPFLVTGVVLVGGATVVANPVVAPPSDIRVSVSDMGVVGERLDILDPAFLESIGAMRQGWPTAVATLDALMANLAEDATTVSPQVLADAMTRVAEIDPALGTPVREESRSGLPLNPPQVINDPTESTVVVLRALANLSSGINEAGITLVQQVAMTPALILALTEQVLKGELTPVEALRRLLSAPFGGQTVLTGDERIDAVFRNSVLWPILDAIAENGNPSVETGTGVADRSGTVPETSTDGSARASAQEQTTLDRKNAEEDEEAADPTAAAAPQRPVLAPDTAPPAADDADPAAGGGQTPGSPVPFNQGGMTEQFRDRLRQALDDIGDTVKRLTGTDDSDTGGTGGDDKTPSPTRPGGAGGSTDDGDSGPTNGVRRGGPDGGN